MKLILAVGILNILGCFSVFAQTQPKPVKVSHAEPIFQDLVRDLGARKGEKEFNLGADFSSGKNYRENGYLAEYEFAPMNRLGLEVETDFSFFSPKNNATKEQIPGNRLDGLRLSAQYTFFCFGKISDFFGFRVYSGDRIYRFQKLWKRKIHYGFGVQSVFYSG